MAHAPLCGMVAHSLSCGVGRVGRVVRRSKTDDGGNEVLKAFQAQHTQAPSQCKVVFFHYYCNETRTTRGTFAFLFEHLAHGD